MVKEAFPFVFDSENIPENSTDLTQSVTFIVTLYQYVRMVRWMKEFGFNEI
jgi:hypothetical protein